MQARSLALQESGPGVKKAFTLDDIISGAYTADKFNGTWVSETEIFYQVDELLLLFDVTKQKSEIIARSNYFVSVHGCINEKKEEV